MKRHLRIDASWIITPWSVAESIARGTQVFVYIDDFLGTGNQFSEIAVVEKLPATFNTSYSVYAPLAAHERGIKALRTTFPHLRVAPAEVLTEEHSIFSPSSVVFDDGVNTPAVAEQFYYHFLASRRITLYGCERRGYGGLELAYTFSHAVPDNCLPILWYSHSADWHPLFDR
jgi:hypothetical protein